MGICAGYYCMLCENCPLRYQQRHVLLYCLTQIKAVIICYYLVTLEFLFCCWNFRKAFQGAKCQVKGAFALLKFLIN